MTTFLKANFLVIKEELLLEHSSISLDLLKKLTKELFSLMKLEILDQVFKLSCFQSLKTKK